MVAPDAGGVVSCGDLDEEVKPVRCLAEPGEQSFTVQHFCRVHGREARTAVGEFARR